MRNKASVGIIFVTIFIDLMGFGILIPILPSFATKQLGISDLGIGAIIAVFSLMQFLFNPLLGRLSDRIGRKPVLLISQGLTVASYLMFSFSTSFILLFLSRLIAGLGGSNIGVAQAYISDITTKEERSKGMGLIGAAFGLGFVFGPVIGAFISPFGYAFAGYASAAFSFTAFMFTIFMLPETVTKKEGHGKFSFKLFDLSHVKKTLKNPSIGILILLFFIIIFSVANIYGTFAILGYKVFGFSDRQNGFLLGISGLVGALVQGGLMRILSKKMNDRTLVLFGSIFMMFGLAMIPFGIGFWTEALIISILSIGTGILQPTIPSMISKNAPEGEHGAVLGLNQSFSAFGRVLGPLWGGFSFDYIGYQFPFLTGALFMLFAFTASYFFLNDSRMKAQQNV